MAIGGRIERIGIQAPLGFAAGLPLLLTGSTLTAWLHDEKVSLATIGLFAWVALPYNFKFLWAPLLDRFSLPWLGRRRGWILATQFLVLAAIATMGTIGVTHGPLVFAVLAASVAAFSASQDIVVDAYRADVLENDELGKGAATYVIAYRAAMIVAGGGALVLSDFASWAAVYWLMAALMVVGMAGVWRAPDPPPIKPPETLSRAVIDPLREFFSRPGVWLVLAIIMLYHFDTRLLTHMVVPFLKEVGFSKSEIGILQKALGLGATIGGVAIGGAWADRIGLLRALLWFGALKALANVGYAALAIAGKSYPLLVASIAVDNLCNGLGFAAFVAFLMSLCHQRFSAFQYALFTSASSLLGRFMGAATGYVVEAIGWAGFIIGTIIAALPALALVAWYRARSEKMS